MIILTNAGTADTLQVTCGTGVTSVECHTSWVDDNSGAMTPGNTNTTITGSTSATTVHTAVTSGHQVNIKTLTVRNVSATATLITISHTINGGTPVVLMTATLQQNYTIQYFDGGPFQVLDPNGAQLVNNQASMSALGAVTNAQFPQGLSNQNSALQSLTPTAGTAYYITSSNINLPATLLNGFKVGTTFRWRISATKTANGTGALSIIFYGGTLGTTGDTAMATVTLPASTAAIDTMMLDITLVWTTVGSSGAFFYSITPMHLAASAAGFGVTSGTAYTGTGTFNTTTASLIFGIGFNFASGGTLSTTTHPTVLAQAFNLD
jgi:hypothetical protein